METQFSPVNQSATLFDMLHVLKDESSRGMTYINSGDSHEYMSYSDMYNDAVSFLGFLQTTGVKAGDEIIIQEEDNKRLLTCFWACIMGGIIPVPLALGGKNEHKLKFFKVWENLNNPFLFSNIDHFKRLRQYGEDLNSGFEEEKFISRFINSSVTCNMPEYAEQAVLQKPKPGDIAFIQYSSGSTGSPKGVILTHENLLYNTHDIVERLGINVTDRALNWIPLTHDLGMIGFHLSCMLVSCQQFVMPTGLFIRRPVLWMEKVHECKASRLYSPNFGYQYFLQALERNQEQKRWDLSSVKSICNGAEPISATLCYNFAEQLSEYGFGSNCITACYGLAEASVGVTSDLADAPLGEYFIERKSLKIGESVNFIENHDLNDTVSFVGAGRPLSHCNIRISGENGDLLPANTVGHIEITGPNVTKGYYNNPEATNESFTEDGWLKTGDLGLILENGSLVITGRQKNMIILHGQNYYSHDVEGVLFDIEDISLGKIVACGIPGNSTTREHLIIFVLYKKPANTFLNTIHAVNDRLSSVLEIMPDDVIPVKEIPKTTSGKIQHHLLSKRYQEGNYDQVIKEINQAMIAATTEEWRQLSEKDRISVINNWLLMKCSALINVAPEELSLIEPLSDQGFKSIHAVQLSQILNKQLGLDSPATILYRYPQINRLTGLINNKLFALSTTEIKPEEQEYDDDSQILDTVESLSDEQIIQLLEEDL